RTSVRLLRQRQHGCRRQELRRAGAGLGAHKRLPDVAGMGVRSHPIPAAAAEPPARAAPVVLVVFHRPAQLAPDPRADATAKRVKSSEQAAVAPEGSNGRSGMPTTVVKG